MRRELLDTIRAVHTDKKRIPPEIAAELAEHATDEDLTSRELDDSDRKREQRDRGPAPNSEDTVKSHITNILAKLGANDRTHAVRTKGAKRAHLADAEIVVAKSASRTSSGCRRGLACDGREGRFGPVSGWPTIYPLRGQPRRRRGMNLRR
jgi:hypothetical protein